MAGPPEPTPEPDIEEMLRSARPLDPADRLRLIARLWASLPSECWAAPSAQQRLEVWRRLGATETDDLGNVPWRIIERLVDRPIATTPAKIYSAPRRFDLATIFVVATAYCLFFAALSPLPLPGVASLVVAGFITLVGVGQAVLYRGLQPRKASIVVGIAICWIWVAISSPFVFQTPRVVGSSWLFVNDPLSG
jgi:hypothetical protein